MSHANGATPATPADLEADVARQRDALAETVSELQARLDVRSRAKEKVAEVPRPALVAAGVGVLVVIGLLVRRRTR